MFFLDYELVYWASYILSKTARKEKLTAYSEVAKRSKKIKELVNFFKEKYCVNISSEKEKDRYARTLVKDYLKFILTNYEKFGDTPCNFWTVTSDWAINNYSNNIELYHQIAGLPDESLD